MRNSFHYDGSIMSVLTVFMTLVLLNWLLLISCIPIVTVGAGITAMYSVIFQYLSGREPKIVTTFIQSFRLNFKKATIAWMGILLLGMSLGQNYRFLSVHQVAGKLLLYIFLSVVAMLWLVLMLYLFPVIAYFDNDIKGHLKYVVCLSVAKLPHTMLLAFVSGLPIIFLLYLAQYFQVAVILLLCVGGSFPAYWSGRIFMKIFAK